MPTRSAARASVDHGSRRAALVRQMLAETFAGRFAPGERMRVEHLAARYDVSATPVREALVELAGVGIVELQPNRGAILRPFGPQQLREICQLRRILECEAVRCATGRIAPFELESLAAELRSLINAPRGAAWSEQTRQLDTRLHELIADRCASDRLSEEIRRYTILYRTLRDARHRARTAHANYSEMEENSEHLAIVLELARGDADAAAAAMSRHIDQAAQALAADLFDAAALAADRVVPFLSSRAAASRPSPAAAKPPLVKSPRRSVRKPRG